ncbi:hypothetical protein A4X13_0g8893, partial [Tilletia indica]
TTLQQAADHHHQLQYVIPSLLIAFSATCPALTLHFFLLPLSATSPTASAPRRCPALPRPARLGGCMVSIVAACLPACALRSRLVFALRALR